MAEGEIVKRKRPLNRPPERYRAFMDGTLSVEDLDDEEIARGRLRAKDGTFKGNVPAVLPREFMLAMQREGQKRFQEFVREAVPEAQKAVLELIKSKHLQPGDATRLKAAEMILERFAGKIVDRVEVKAEISNWEHVANQILVDVEEDDDNFK